MSSDFYLLSTVLDRFEEARSSEKKVYVSDVAGHFSKRHAGKSSFEAGRRLHSRFWGDPWAVLDLEEVCLPFPLAWRFEFGWLLGVADQVCFRRARPFSVIEYKSYPGFSKADIVQVSLYALLVELNFAAKPQVIIMTKTSITRIKPAYVLDALAKARHIVKKRNTG